MSNMTNYEMPNWGNFALKDGHLEVFEDQAWHPIDLTDETILRLLVHVLNDGNTWREIGRADGTSIWQIEEIAPHEAEGNVKR